jgi:phenylacetate-CoA ligase
MGHCDEDWQHIEDLTAVQDAGLARVLAAAARSPFYRRRGVPADRAGFDRLPLTTKRDLREAYPFGLLAVGPDAVAVYHESSGTAGEPTASCYGDDDWADVEERFGRKHVGLGPGDVMLVRTPYALMMTGHMAHGGARRRGAMVVPADNRSAVMPYARVIRLLRDLGVTLTWSLPTEPLVWAAAARAAGLDPAGFATLRAMFVAGEPLGPARRRRIEEIWKVPLVDDYGSTETGPLAGHCPSGRLHLWADRVLFEVYDPATGRVGPDGRGQLVVTPLRRRAMPLLRYNLEDEVEVSHRPCPCGWALPTVRVLGRAGAGVAVGRVRVSQAGLEEAVFGLPIEHGVLFWRARTDGTGLEIEIEVEPAHAADAVALVTEAVVRRYALTPRVTGRPPGSLMPSTVLTAPAQVHKPRGLFGPGEDWDRALLYY